MKNAAIIIDKWKLPTFEKMLKREGHDYVLMNGLTGNTLVLSVNCKSLSKLKHHVEQAYDECHKLRETREENQNANQGK